MSHTNNYYPHYVQHNSYDYDDRELESPNDYFPHAPRYMHNRQPSQDLGTYRGRDAYSHGYEPHSEYSNPRHYAPPIETIQYAPPVYDHTGRHSSYSTSPTSASTMSRHGSNGGVSPILDRHSSTSSASSARPVCPHEDCRDEHGRPTKYFSRKADVQRHLRSQHADPSINCPKPRCNRKGSQGFTRTDHLTEHLRQYHGADIPKRNSGGSSRESRSRHAA